MSVGIFGVKGVHILILLITSLVPKQNGNSASNPQDTIIIVAYSVQGYPSYFYFKQIK